MSMRPLAPLAVIGAGLLMMSLATRTASADDAGAPGAVAVATSGEALVITWTAPAGTTALRDYDLRIVDPRSGEQVLERSLDAAATGATIRFADLDGHDRLTVAVTAVDATGGHHRGRAVRVSLPEGPTRPTAAPAVRVEGRLLRVSLPDAPDGVVGRVVQLYRDGSPWTTIAVDAGRAIVTRHVAAGRRYSVAYRDVDANASGALSERSAPVKASEDRGPTAVRRIRLSATSDGLRVRWRAAEPRGAELTQYRVTATKDGERTGSAFTAPDVRSVVLPGVTDGLFAITVVAVDAAGARSSSTVVLRAAP